jgi:hypothetical protein
LALRASECACVLVVEFTLRHKRSLHIEGRSPARLERFEDLLLFGRDQKRRARPIGFQHRGGNVPVRDFDGAIEIREMRVRGTQLIDIERSVLALQMLTAALAGIDERRTGLLGFAERALRERVFALLLIFLPLAMGEYRIETETKRHVYARPISARCASSKLDWS